METTSTRRAPPVMDVVCARRRHASLYLVRAAVTAPSLYNTQPWIFVAGRQDSGVEVHADLARRMLLTDPHGREMVISCGAALFNLRLAMRHLGFNPVVESFPRPVDRAYLARVRWGARSHPTADEQRLFDALRLRHTVRGPFLPRALPASLVDTLHEHAHREGATLHIVDDTTTRQHLAELTRTAEEGHRTDAGHTTEQATWTRRHAWACPDGIPADADVLHPDRTAFAGRDYAGLARAFPTPPRRRPGRTGLVALLGTDRDDRPAWLRAGQALQRILLEAAAHDVMAAFHTQPLEVPRLRAQIRPTLSGGGFPQMILRLGYVPCVRPLPRRPVTEVLRTAAAPPR